MGSDFSKVIFHKEETELQYHQSPPDDSSINQDLDEVVNTPILQLRKPRFKYLECFNYCNYNFL